MLIKYLIKSFVLTSLFFSLTVYAESGARQASHHKELTIAAPDPERFDLEAMVSLVERIEDDEFVNVEALLIAHKNQLVLERYFNGWRANRAHPLRSAGKSLVSAAMGLIIDDGKFEGPEVPVAKIFENTFGELENPDPRKYDIRLHHILTMSDGLDCGPILDPLDPCGERLFRKEYPTKTFFDRPMRNAPGEKYNYTDAAPLVALTLVAGLSRMSYEDFINERLFKPMNFHISSNAERLVARDFLKFGMLYLNKGRWQGQQLISEDWVKRSTAVQFSFPEEAKFAKGYGYYWWVRDFEHAGHKHEAFMAAGNGGQYTIVVPELSLVVSMFASNYDRNDETQGQPLQIMQAVINTLKAEPAKAELDAKETD